MEFIPQIIFILAFGVAAFLIRKRVLRIAGNIQLGKSLTRTDKPSQRLKTMILIALGQGKMFHKPIAGFMHLFIYVGFILVNIEVLEIVLDGILGTHRIFTNFLPASLYGFLIGFFELLAVLVIVACVVFLIRRNIIKVERFTKPELKGWASLDANLILIIEVVLMFFILTMNATDSILQTRTFEHNHYAHHQTAPFLFSQFLMPIFSGIENNTILVIIERICWWGHILGIMAFALYVTYSKHLHIFLAFPNTYFSNLEPKGKFENMASVTNEVKLALELIQDDGTAPPPPTSFGANDVNNLTWKNIMDSYSCTECGRCTAACPANITGKKLSPRKVMMDTRDRAEEVGSFIEKGKTIEEALTMGNTLFSDTYISKEELMACTTCNACAEACPINIDPLNIIMQMRQYVALEESSVPQHWARILQNIQNNGSPWQISPAERFNWAEDVK
ncbi:MAG: (Fe-S)-binding protein [Bacteroidetes bacterium]|nr:MAG: (Fe-S)-binding protein [Bacteroidota bacterium]TAG87149.1 MAG: (Fe-S)-binding protein [Bacteroidota bacterium]